MLQHTDVTVRSASISQATLGYLPTPETAELGFEPSLSMKVLSDANTIIDGLTIVVLSCKRLHPDTQRPKLITTIRRSQRTYLFPLL
jgi:hypothetical protein